jgi:leucyl aminopeptidase
MDAAKFTGKRDQTLEILAPGKGIDRLILTGAGEVSKLKDLQWELTGGLVAATLLSAKQEGACVSLALGKTSPRAAARAAALIASGAKLRNYAFVTYKSKKPENKLLSSLDLVCPNPAEAKAEFATLSAVAEGVHMARDLVNEPANVLHPEEFAARVKALAKAGVKVEVLGPAQMKKLGMGALLGVAQGSDFEPRLVVMHWGGGKKGEAPVAFVGKGVTFDTGGVSIKPAGGMEDMKGDMAGAAAVSGLMLALAKRKAKANVIGAIGLVENAIGGAAQRPGDIVKSMSGQTIAVLNTDAEGRLVLADVCWYVQDRFKPKFMVDLATLTGAIMVALGKEHAGLFANDDKLAERLLKAGAETGEKLWRMPLSPEYDKAIDSDIADMKNIGSRYGGAITGAQFIQRFVNQLPWAHLDIAGTAFDSVKNSLNSSWGSGWGVRLLNRLVASHYED